jgi:hypothetical protein
MYIAGGGKRRDSWAGVAIYHAAKKAISYQATLKIGIKSKKMLSIGMDLLKNQKLNMVRPQRR